MSKKIEIEMYLDENGNFCPVDGKGAMIVFKGKAKSTFEAGEVFNMRFEEIAENKTVQQNRWFWKMLRDYLVPALRGIGYDVLNEVEAAEWVRGVYLQKAFEREKNGVVKTIVSTRGISELNKEEMCNLIDRIVTDFAQLGYVIPDADPDKRTTPYRPNEKMRIA